MADYREISQTYAHEAIKTCLALNSGAVGILLTQAGELRGQGLADDVSWASLFWTIGATLAASCWFLGFLSARYVDKSEREADRNGNLNVANRFQGIGLWVLALSLALFLIGAIFIALALGVEFPATAVG